jgi:Spy/CpxP family protein refolding chaperone
MESKKPVRENKMEEFADEFRKDNIDRNKLLELGQKKEQEMKEMKEFMLDKIIEFHSILTPEQRNKAVDEMKNMKEKFGKMHDRQGRPGDDRGGFRDRKD